MGEGHQLRAVARLQLSYQVPALPAGSDMFLCDVHPNVTGTVTVQ